MPHALLAITFASAAAVSCLVPVQAAPEVAVASAITADATIQTKSVETFTNAELEQQARTAVETKDFERARELYRVLTAREPANLEYLLAIGRVLSYLQDYAGADQAYDEVLNQRPDSVDALVGKAYVQMWQERYKQADELLNKARQLAPTSVDVRIANARLLRYQGQAARAREEAQAVLQADPNSTEAQELLRDIVLPPRYEIQKGLERESLASGIDNTRAFVSVTALRPQGRVGLTLERWRRFGENENRFGLNASQRLSDKWSINGQIFLSPGATVVSKRDLSIGVARSLTKRAVLALTYRNTRFSTATSQTLSPSLEYYFRDPSWLQVTLHRNKSHNHDTDSDNRSNSFSLRYNRQVSDALLVYAGFGRGQESFENLLTPSTGLFEQFTEDSYLLGAKWQFSPRYSLEAFGLRRSREEQRASTLGLSLTSRL
jgi:YaiO family outer membrane protein